MTKKTITFSPHEDGLISLRTPLDLYKKLEYEQTRLVSQGVPHIYDIINFIITSHSLVDWCNRYYTTKEDKVKIDNHKLLRVCRHISNGAKHFELTNPHNAISGIKREGYVSDSYYERLPGQPVYLQEDILIDVIDHETGSNETINFLDFSSEILSFWEKELKRLEGPQEQT